MDLTDKAQELSKKYNTSYIDTEYFLVDLFINELFTNPMRTIIKTESTLDKVYNFADRALRYRQHLINKGKVETLIPVYDF